jgi:adenylate cyclase
LEMLVQLEQLNARWRADGRKEWQIGIGLNHGDVIVGNMGSLERMEFTVIGDAVNLGSRLEGATKTYHLQLLIGEKVAALVREEFYLQTVDLLQVKGKTEPVEIFTVLGERSKEVSEEIKQFLEIYEKAILLFRERKFSEGKEFFNKALRLRPDDITTRGYIKSCEEFIIHPPESGWTGVRVMTEK